MRNYRHPYADYAKFMRELCENYARIMRELCGNYAEIMRKLCEIIDILMRIMRKLCKNYAEIMRTVQRTLCKLCEKNMRKLCGNYANYAEVYNPHNSYNYAHPTLLMGATPKTPPFRRPFHQCCEAAWIPRGRHCRASQEGTLL